MTDRDDLAERLPGTEQLGVAGVRAARVAFVVACGFALYSSVASIEPGLATDGIGARFGLGAAGVGTLSSAYYWVYAPMQLAAGALLDRFGPHRLLWPAIAACAAGIALTALAAGPGLGTLGRLLCGLGGSFGFLGALHVASHRFAPARFALLSGTVNAVALIGAGLGGIALSAVMDAWDWRGVFLATAAVGALLCALAAAVPRERPSPGRAAPGGSARSIVAHAARDRSLWAIAVCSALFYLPLGTFGGLWGRDDLVSGHGLGSLDAEAALAWLFAGGALGSVGAGALSDRLGHRKALVVGSALLASAPCAALAWWPAGST